MRAFSLFSKALYYELLGKKNIALSVYTDILRQDPSNTKAKISIRRLSGTYTKFSKLNQNMFDNFVKMNNEEEFLEFEKWLLKIQK